MRFFSRAGLFAALLALSGLPLPFAVPADPGFDPGVREAYACLRDALYNSQPLPELEALYGRALDLLQAAELEPAEGEYWSVRIEYLIGRGYQLSESKAKAARHYEQGLACLERGGSAAQDSEGWRMRSEILGQLCLVKDLGFLIKNGMKAVRHAEKARELDPRNVGALIILADSKIYPPPVFGGNAALGLERMRQALALGPVEPDDLFNVYLGLGLACGKLKRAAEARGWFDKALALYPGNSYARSERGKLGE